jgi:hypothetical protein
MTTQSPAIERSPFDASASAVGYLFQIRSALLLAVKRDDSADHLSLEMIDDVSFDPTDLQAQKPVELLQFKHSLRKKAALTDRSVDLWKTLRVWSELIGSKRIDPQRTIFTLATTATASSGSALSSLRHSERDPEKAREVLELAGSSSTNTNVQQAFKSLSRLNVSDRQALFISLYLLDSSPSVQETRRLLEHELRYLVDDPQRQLAGFTDRLEGWWFRTAIDHLVAAQKTPIAVGVVQRQVRDLREQFKRECLPDDFLMVSVPDDHTSADDERCFVRQLVLIHASSQQVRLAQENYYRAYQQRSLWVRENLLGLDEIDSYEHRLIDEWRQKQSIALDGLSKTARDDEKAVCGKGIYNWTQETAVGMAALFIRPQFQSGYMVRGSFHMLADLVRIGWHPDFHTLLSLAKTGAKANA